MKTLTILALFIVTSVSAQLQTNTFLTNCIGETKRKVTLKHETLWINGEAIYRPQSGTPALTWWYSNTNVVTASFTNLQCAIQIVDGFGDFNDGFGSVSITNPIGDPYRFEIYKGTNAPVPTNGTPIPLTVIGVTNYP